MVSLQQLLSLARRAVEDYEMIEEGDKIAVGLSGGKDSVALLNILASLKRFYPKKFEVIAITVDMGLGYDEQEVKDMQKLCETLGVFYHIEKTDIGEIVFNVRKEPNPCALCAKMRRGALNEATKKLGCNKVALGHHADDLSETLFLSMIYEGRLSTFSPVTFLDKTGLTVIRPMIYIPEKDISSFSKTQPILHNPCPADKHTQREYVKKLLNDIRKDIPFAKDRIHSAITHPERYNLFDKAKRFAEERKRNSDDGNDDK